MDIVKLIERLRQNGVAYMRAYGRYSSICNEVITALSTLQAENEKLRVELESKETYYEQMIDALSATDSADLAQMTACAYYKPGGLCRYGGDDPANVCVLGPCPHERTAEEVLADLARVTAERDGAVSDIENALAYGLKDCELCVNVQCYVRGGTKPCLPKWRGPQKED